MHGSLAHTSLRFQGAFWSIQPFCRALGPRVCPVHRQTRRQTDTPHTQKRLWNQLSASLRQPRTDLSNSDSESLSSLSGASSIGSIDSPLSSSIALSLFQTRLKNFFFSVNPSHRSLPFLLQDCMIPRIPGLFTDTPKHIRFFYFLVFLFSTF